MSSRYPVVVPLLFVLSCAESMSREPDNGYLPGERDCFQNSDCPPGLSCVDFLCVADDGLPPEEEEERTFLRPVASESRVFALSPEADSMAIIDPLTLSIEAVRLPEDPIALAVLPGDERVVVLSRTGAALSVVSLSAEGPKLSSVATPRRFSALSLSPDGRWALLWTPDGEIPDAGAEGIVALVEVDALAAGTAVVLERAAGRRHTNVFFRSEGETSVDAVIVGQGEIAVLPLDAPQALPLPTRILLPDEYAQILTREALSPPSGDYVLLRSLSTAELGIFDVATRSLSRLPLPGVASDLDLTTDGTRAVAVLRERSQVVRFSLPSGADLTVLDVSLPGSDCDEETLPCLVAPGQAVLVPDGSAAALFTNARRSEAFGWVDFESEEFTTFSRLQKLVRTLGISPDGTHALVLHRPDPGSTVADTYERTVDRSEGYSIVELTSGLSQLKLTDKVPPLEFVWAGDGRHAAVSLREDTSRSFRVDAIDLETLIVSSLALASAPQYSGPFPGSSADARMWVTQEHPAGRISFIDLSTHSVRTATGYELNSEIE